MESIKDLVQQYTDVRQTLIQLDDELRTHWTPNKVGVLDPDDLFPSIMAEYQKAAAHRFKNLEALYATMDSKWKAVISFFGHDPKIMRPHDFFSVFAKFLNQWKVKGRSKDQPILKANRLLHNRISYAHTLGGIH